MDDGLTNASRAIAAQNGVGAKGDHDDGDADDVIVTVDPLRVKRVRQMDVTGSEDHVLDPPEGERMLALLAQLDGARARAAQRKGARGGKGGRKRRDRGEADGDAGGDENERVKGRKGQGGGGEDLKGGGGKAAGAGGAGGKAVAEAHGEWAWQGVMSQLTSAQEELRVIVDLVNAVESGAEGLAVSGVSKPKQHAAEMSSELTARLAGKLTLLQVGAVRFSVLVSSPPRLPVSAPVCSASSPFSLSSAPLIHSPRSRLPLMTVAILLLRPDVGGGLLHAAARLTQQVSDDAPFYTALQRIQHRWKVKRTHPALAPPPTPLSAASSTAAGFAADVTVQSLLLSLPHAPSLPASMPLIPATSLPFTSLRLDRDKQGMLRAAPPEGQPIRRLHVSVFGREAGGDNGGDGGAGARISSEGLVGKGGEEEGEGGRMAEGKEGEEGAEEKEEGGVGRAVRQAHELLRAAQRSWFDWQSAAARVYLGEAYLLLQQQAQERARNLRFQLLDSEIEGEGEGEEEREGGDGGTGMRCGGGGERGEARVRAAGGLEWWGRSEGGGEGGVRWGDQREAGGRRQDGDGQGAGEGEAAAVALVLAVLLLALVAVVVGVRWGWVWGWWSCCGGQRHTGQRKGLWSDACCAWYGGAGSVCHAWYGGAGSVCHAWYGGAGSVCHAWYGAAGSVCHAWYGAAGNMCHARFSPYSAPHAASPPTLLPMPLLPLLCSPCRFSPYSAPHAASPPTLLPMPLLPLLCSPCRFSPYSAPHAVSPPTLLPMPFSPPLPWPVHQARLCLHLTVCSHATHHPTIAAWTLSFRSPSSCTALHRTHGAHGGRLGEAERGVGGTGGGGGAEGQGGGEEDEGRGGGNGEATRLGEREGIVEVEAGVEGGGCDVGGDRQGTVGGAAAEEPAAAAAAAAGAAEDDGELLQGERRGEEKERSGGAGSGGAGESEWEWEVAVQLRDVELSVLPTVEATWSHAAVGANAHAHSHTARPLHHTHPRARLLSLPTVLPSLPDLSSLLLHRVTSSCLSSLLAHAHSLSLPASASLSSLSFTTASHRSGPHQGGGITTGSSSMGGCGAGAEEQECCLVARPDAAAGCVVWWMAPRERALAALHARAVAGRRPGTPRGGERVGYPGRSNGAASRAGDEEGDVGEEGGVVLLGALGVDELKDVITRAALC
ncbi:unnamed protein product [Closterium sp. NIES-65]|nr:unnamed protein product [Closterium sp. NIES-65]